MDKLNISNFVPTRFFSDKYFFTSKQEVSADWLQMYGEMVGEHNNRELNNVSLLLCESDALQMVTATPAAVSKLHNKEANKTPFSSASSDISAASDFNCRNVN